MFTRCFSLLTFSILIQACNLYSEGYSKDSYEGVKNKSQATFAGGCFWCIEAPFDKTPGVLSAISGYSGGDQNNPTY